MVENELDDKTFRELVSLELTIDGGGIFLFGENGITMDKQVTRFDLASISGDPIAAIDGYLSRFEFKAFVPNLEPFGSNLGSTMCDRFRDMITRIDKSTMRASSMDGSPICRLAVTYGAAWFKLEPVFRLDDQVVVSVVNDTRNLKALWENNSDCTKKDSFWNVDVSFPGKHFYRGKSLFSVMGVQDS